MWLSSIAKPSQNHDILLEMTHIEPIISVSFLFPTEFGRLQYAFTLIWLHTTSGAGISVLFRLLSRRPETLPTRSPSVALITCMSAACHICGGDYFGAGAELFNLNPSSDAEPMQKLLLFYYFTIASVDLGLRCTKLPVNNRIVLYLWRCNTINHLQLFFCSG